MWASMQLHSQPFAAVGSGHIQQTGQCQGKNAWLTHNLRTWASGAGPKSWPETSLQQGNCLHIPSTSPPGNCLHISLQQGNCLHSANTDKAAFQLLGIMFKRTMTNWC